jgi:hypothetical protein
MSPSVAPSGEPTGSRTFLEHWRNNKGAVLWGLVVALIAVVATYALPRIGADPSSGGLAAAPPSEISTPANLAEYLRLQPIWTGTPTTFTATLHMSLAFQASTGQRAAVRLNSTGTDIEAHSVEDIAQNGAGINLGSIIVVGRVRSASTSPATWAPGGRTTPGPNHDVVLESPNKKTIVFGLVAGDLSSGAVVYFPGVVVAVGHTRGGAVTAYVVGLSAAISRSPTSGAIRILIDAYSVRATLKRND